MSKISLILLSVMGSLAMAANCTLRLSPWTSRTAAPQVHIEGATAVVDNKLYLMGGFGYAVVDPLTLIPTNRVDIYDPSTNQWSGGATTPFNASHCQGTTTIPFLNQSPHELDRYIWVVAGFQGPHPGGPTNKTWRYDTINNTWQDFAALPAVRASGGLALEGTTLHYVGGMKDRNTDQATHFTYDLAADLGYWENTTEFPYPRNHFQARAINGKVYMLGGQYHHDDGVQDVNVAHSYDISTKAYTRLQDLPFPRSHSEPGTVVVYDWIVQIGGRNMYQNDGDGNINLNKVFAYDTQNDQWHFLEDLPAKRIGAAAGFFKNITVDGVLGDYIVATAGGIDYDIGATDTWIAQVFLDCDESEDDGNWVSTYGTYPMASSSSPSSSTSSQATSSTSLTSAASTTPGSSTATTSSASTADSSDSTRPFAPESSNPLPVGDNGNQNVDSSSATIVSASLLILAVSMFL